MILHFTIINDRVKIRQGRSRPSFREYVQTMTIDIRTHACSIPSSGIIQIFEFNFGLETTPENTCRFINQSLTLFMTSLTFRHQGEQRDL